MTTTVDLTFVDLPIHGDKSPTAKRVAQRPEAEFIPILQAVLDDPTIKEIRWNQYTPYWNDGDPCVFHAYFRGILVDGMDADDEENFEDWPPYGAGLALIGRRDWRKDSVYEGPDEARYDRVDALAKAIMNSEFDEVLLDKFGDHAEIKIVPKDGIYIDFYQHD